jgi:acyl transferase domain-containing protein
MISRPPETANGTHDDDALPAIAVVGMACRLPGGASTPSKFWEMIANKRSGRSEIPKSRMNVDAFYHPDPDRGGSVS